MKPYKIKLFNHIYKLNISEDNVEELYLFFNRLKGNNEKQKRIIYLFDEFLISKKYIFKKKFIYCKKNTLKENYKALKKYILNPYITAIKMYIKKYI